MYDLIVIGGGIAGYTAAEDASKAGKKVLLIEKDLMGGTCLNRGCIPSKMCLHYGKLKYEFLRMCSDDLSDVHYLTSKKLYTEIDTKVSMIRNSLEKRLNGYGISIVNGSATIISEKK